ncbi:hypothetical protein ACP70R_041388 [Stipagrostis hirtigluma subsp. patula]
MELLTLADPVDLAARPGCSDGVQGATARRRTPGRWRRIPRPPSGSQPPSEEPSLADQVRPGLAVWREAQRVQMEEMEAAKREMLQEADDLENMPDDDPCFTEEAQAAWRDYKVKFAGYLRQIASDSVSYRPTPPPSDTEEEHLSAEDMENIVSGRPVCPQARHFATLALNHYNLKKMHKFKMETVLLSKCFSERDGATFAHVNFTAISQGQSVPVPAKRLFFAELMLIPELQADETKEPMRVLHVCTIDDSCYGGCHEMKRDIKKSLRHDKDYERCHACSARIKHPKGDKFAAGHNSTRMPYYSAFPWIKKN